MKTAPELQEGTSDWSLDSVLVEYSSVTDPNVRRFHSFPLEKSSTAPSTCICSSDFPAHLARFITASIKRTPIAFTGELGGTFIPYRFVVSQSNNSATDPDYKNTTWDAPTTEESGNTLLQKIVQAVKDYLPTPTPA